MGVIRLYNPSRWSSLKVQPKTKGLKVFCHSDLWGIFFLNTKSDSWILPTSKQIGALISNLFLTLFLPLPRYFANEIFLKAKPRRFLYKLWIQWGGMWGSLPLKCTYLSLKKWGWNRTWQFFYTVFPYVGEELWGYFSFLCVCSNWKNPNDQEWNHYQPPYISSALDCR